MYTLDIQTGEIKNVRVNDDGACYNFEYRGGTPGYKLNDDDDDSHEYYGYGHRTYHVHGVLTHDVFQWIVTFNENELPQIRHVSVTQPPNSMNICDPTSVVEINGIRYLITAEAEHPWFCEQDYVTNVYAIL